MPDVLSRMPHACTILVISDSSLLQDIRTTQQHDPYTQQLISDMEMQRAVHGSLRMQQGLLMVHGHGMVVFIGHSPTSNNIFSGPIWSWM